MGMPVHSKFIPTTLDEKRVLKSQLGLDPDKFTVFVNSGWIGGGNIPQIYEALVRDGSAAGLDIQTIVVAGRNELLLHKAQVLASDAHFPVKVFGYTSDMDLLMKASDVMLSKLGGLTTFEALSCRLPIIADTVTPPMPQEMQTAAFLENTGSGLMLKRPGQIVSVVKSLIDDPAQYKALQEAAGLHGRPGASDQIARDVLRYLEQSPSPPMKINQTKRKA